MTREEHLRYLQERAAVLSNELIETEAEIYRLEGEIERLKNEGTP